MQRVIASKRPPGAARVASSTAQLGQAGLLLLLLVLLVLVERHPKSTKDHDHDDGHQQLVNGEAVLSGALAHRDRIGCSWKQLSGAAATTRSHCYQCGHGVFLHAHHRAPAPYR